jgi:GDP-4-dehydro-6-deoxy-D-mannose reductase
MPERILITGAAGFVGRHLLRTLRAAWPGATLIAAARPHDVQGAPPAEADAVLDFDLLDVASIDACVAEAAPDACVHLAALADVAASFKDPDLVWRANVDGTRALAAALLRTAPGAVLVNAGSAEVYGLSFRAGGALDESALLRPANPYAAAKAAADIALGEAALRGLHVLRMRPLNHIGPGQSPRFAVANFARQVAAIAAGRQAPLIRTGALNRARDFLDVRDICAAYAAAIAHAAQLEPGSVFNLASGTPRLMADVLRDLLEAAGVSATIETDAAALRPLDLERTTCTSAAAQAALHWQPRVTWGETLRDVLGWWGEEEGQGALPPGPPLRTSP